MTRYLWLYLSAAAVLLPLDILWLGYVARGFYQSQMASLLLPSPRYGVALTFYLVYLVGIVIFAMVPALRGTPVLGAGLSPWMAAALTGAALGLLAYGTYDATNYATIRGFPLMVALVDVAWGIVVTAAAAGLGTLIATRVFGVTPDL